MPVWLLKPKSVLGAKTGDSVNRVAVFQHRLFKHCARHSAQYYVMYVHQPSRTVIPASLAASAYRGE